MHPAPPRSKHGLASGRRRPSLQSRFYEARGAHFAVRFEGPGDELLARRAVDRLEEQYWRIGQTLTAYPPNPITVVLYTQQQFRDITRMPSWTAAAYDGRIHVPMRGALEQTEELDRVLGHEFVHAVVVMLGGRNVRCGSTKDWPRTWSAAELRKRREYSPRHGHGQRCSNCTAASPVFPVRMHRSRTLSARRPSAA
jgi:hypothetical protein